MLFRSKKDEENKVDGKRKAPEPDVSSSDSDDDMSFGARVQQLGYRQRIEQQMVPHVAGPSVPVERRIEPPAMDYFEMYKEYLARPRLMDTRAVEDPDEPNKFDMSY